MQWQNIKKYLYDLDYIASDELAMSIHIASRLGRPLLLEGEAGIGKTALAIALSKLHETTLIRLQCYEGLDSTSTIYEWNYQNFHRYYAFQERTARSAIQQESFECFYYS